MVNNSTLEQSTDQKDQQNKQLVERFEVEDTPFTVICNYDKGQSFIVMGDCRITEPLIHTDFRNEAQEANEILIEDAKSITWNRLIQCVMIIVDKAHQIQELTRTNKKINKEL